MSIREELKGYRDLLDDDVLDLMSYAIIAGAGIHAICEIDSIAKAVVRPLCWLPLIYFSVSRVKKIIVRLACAEKGGAK